MCQRFGQTQEHCMSQAICVSCGHKAHSPPCQSSPHCVNCNGPHGSDSRDCTKFHMEREIQRLGPQISCHSPRLGFVTKHSTRSIFHGVLFQFSNPPIIPPRLLRLHDLLASVFNSRLLLPHLLMFSINAQSFLRPLLLQLSPKPSLKVENLILLLFLNSSCS